MATYSLSGAGVQALSSNVTALHVDITTVPTNSGQGSANPPNRYHVALLRLGDATGYFDAVPVVGGPQWLAVPSGTTRCGYACQGGAVISLSEVIGGTPPFGGGGALSGLSDVALASVADAQVLTYQASSSKWINATPSGGGGGSISTLSAVLSTAVFIPTSQTFVTALSLTLTAGTWFIIGQVQIENEASPTDGICRLAIGSTIYANSEGPVGGGGGTGHLNLIALITLASSSTLNMQATTWAGNNAYVLPGNTLLNQGPHATQLLGLKVA